jgi:hypothetical protein
VLAEHDVEPLVLSNQTTIHNYKKHKSNESISPGNEADRNNNKGNYQAWAVT